MGAVRAIDLDDFDPENRVVHLRHRPEGREEYGTPLKNGSDGERIINISAGLRAFVDDYVEYTRQEVVDRYGREPLFTTSSGRPSTATIRRDFYKMIRPCTYANKCPHDRDPADCEAAQNSNAAKCPSSFSTHPMRKWSIMHQLDEGVPKELLSDRVDVSVPVLDKHNSHSDGAAENCEYRYNQAIIILLSGSSYFYPSKRPDRFEKRSEVHIMTPSIPTMLIPH